MTDRELFERWKYLHDRIVKAFKDGDYVTWDDAMLDMRDLKQEVFESWLETQRWLDD